jgi:hypothetical protein
VALFCGQILAGSLSDTLDVTLQLDHMAEDDYLDLLFDIQLIEGPRRNDSINDFKPVPPFPSFHPGRQFQPDIFNMNCAFGEFVFCCILASSATGVFRKRLKTKLDLSVFWWFAFDGAIHLFMEGSFVLISLENRFHGGAAVSDRHYLMTCVWTEYGKADYRWLYGDQNIVGFELVTVFFEAPLCFLILYGILNDSNWRHVVQIFICMGELYGLFATFVPEWLYQSPNLDASTFLYSWIYLGSNVPWAIIPLILTAQSTVEICKSFQRSKDFDRKRPQPQTSG